MNRTFLALTIATQLAAAAAFAQTSDAPTGATASASADGTFGSDWSTTLGTALFGQDGTTLRPGTEIATQWQTLSDEDKTMIRRDCMAYMQVPGDTTSATSADPTAATTTDTTTAATGASPMMNVTAQQMEQICAATKDL